MAVVLMKSMAACITRNCRARAISERRNHNRICPITLERHVTYRIIIIQKYLFFTLCSPNFAGLHVAQQGDQVFNDAEVLRARGAAGVDGDGHQQLLNVTHHQFVFIRRNPTEPTTSRKSSLKVLIMYYLSY